MVRTSTIIVIVICTIIVAVGGLSAYYLKSSESAAIEAKKAREASVAAEVAAEAAELKAAMSKANTQTVKSDYEFAAEQLALAKAGAGASKYNSDAEKTNAESILIIASRAFEEAAARLQEAEMNELTDTQDLQAAQDRAEAARITLEAAEESARIISDGQDAADVLALQSAIDVAALGELADDAISSAQGTAAEIRDAADGICRQGVCPLVLSSQNGGYNVKMQSDGNLIVYDMTDKAIWATNTSGQGTGPYTLKMQANGNLVVRDSGNVALWSSGTAGQGTPPYRLVMQDDRNLVVYDSTDTSLWNSGTTLRNFSLRTYNTNATDDGQGNVIFLDRQHVNCGNDALTGFKLARPTDTTVNYNVTCMEGVDSEKSSWRTTNKDEIGGGNVIYLDRHKVDCGLTPIVDFKLRNVDNVNMDYAFKCSNLPHDGECRDLITRFDETGNGGNMVYLDRQDVQCGEGEVMTSFKLGPNDSGNRMNYKYTCCRMPR